MTPGDRLRTIEQIQALATEIGSFDWPNSGDPRPPTENAIMTAIRAVVALPDEIPAPDIGVESDGSPTLEWRAESNDVVSVSACSDGRYAWAKTARNPRSGWADDITGEVLAAIREVLGLAPQRDLRLEAISQAAYELDRLYEVRSVTKPVLWEDDGMLRVTVAQAARDALADRPTRSLFGQGHFYARIVRVLDALLRDPRIKEGTTP